MPAQSGEITETPVKILSLENWANDVEVSPFGTFIAIATRDNYIRILDSEYRQLYIFRGRFNYPTSGVLGFTQDEKYLLFAKYQSEEDIGVVDLEKMEPAEPLTGHDNTIYCFTVSSNGRFAASGAYKGELIVWHRTPDGFELMQKSDIPDRAIRKVVFSHDGSRLAVVFLDDTIDIFTLDNGRFEHHQNLAPKQYYGNTGYLYGLGFSPDDETLVAGLRNELTVWEWRSGKYQEKQVIPDVGDSYIQSLAFTPDGKYFACGFGRGEVRFLEKLSDGWREVKTVSGKQDYVHDIAFSPDGKLMVTGSRTGNTLLIREMTGIGADAVMKYASLTGLPYSRAQKKIISNDTCMDLLSLLDHSLTAPRDEFETREEYEHRVRKLRGQAIRLLQDYTEEQYGIRDTGTGVTPGSIAIPPETLLDYNIENERYTFRFMNTLGAVTIPRNEARSLKQNWSDGLILAVRADGPDGYSRTYSGFTLIHPESGKSYDISVEENPFRAVPVDKTASYIFEKKIGPHITIRELVLHNIFPVFYRYYDNNSIGTAEVVNTGTAPVEGLHIDLFIHDYMDNPKEASVPAELGVNRSASIELFALLNSRVLDVSEGDTLSVKIAVQYTAEGKEYSGEIVQSVDMYDRNAIMWDDDRKVAAFVTAKDPAILRYSKRVTGMVAEPAGSALNRNLLQAMRLFEGLRASGLVYIIDPSTPYSDFSTAGTAIDFLQFPRQTLEYGAGDCDDLSVLYNALLESIGIKTAFITVPGHIFTAFDTGLKESEARRLFSSPEELIFIDGKTWIPVETTLLSDGFLKAWETGLGLYNRFSSIGDALFFSTEEAWKEYRPVGIDSEGDISIPSISAVTENYSAEIVKYREKEIFVRENRLLSEIAEDEGNVVLLNKLGILYSRYGVYDSALEQFDKILARNSYLPAIMNKGNIYSILGDYSAALEYYSRAVQEHPDNPRIILCLAMVHIERGELKEAEELYHRLKRIDTVLAAELPLFGSPGMAEAGGTGSTSRAAEQDGASEIFSFEWE